MRIVASLDVIEQVLGAACADVIRRRRETEKGMRPYAEIRRLSDGVVGQVTTIYFGDEPEYGIDFEDGSHETHDFNSLEQLEIVSTPHAL